MSELTSVGRTGSAMVLSLPLLFGSCVYTPEVEPRPATWAEPVAMEGLPNLHRVSPELYRSALPDDDGYRVAGELGAKTVVNLRPAGSDRGPAGPGEPDYVSIPVRTSQPASKQAREFFDILDDEERTPVLLHCYHGADRTGAFTALYRINRQGWSRDEAIREMTGGGFHFHTMWKSLIEWVRQAPEF